MIIPQDDGFHGINTNPSVEWWYFDGVFDNGYGIHVGIKVISFGRWGFVRELINIYKDTELKEKAYGTRTLDDYQISKKYPDIQRNGHAILSFDYNEYNKSDQWNYLISLDVNNLAVQLEFKGVSQGFKYTTSHEGWTVAQPKATVYGTLQINKTIIPVQGTGYHDHNWNFSTETGARATGWYWGKVTSANYTLTWAKIKKTTFADETIITNLGILNTKHKGFEFIHPQNITFTTSDLEYHNGRFIPTVLKLKIKQDDIDIDVKLTATSIQRNRPKLLTLHYWRYFVSVDGYIKKADTIDYLKDDIQIIEYMRFI
jgi:predicted secreted hydrolase